jgi:leucine dehydrogenase
MDIFSQMHALGHEQLLLSHDPSCGYSGIIAIHDTTLGPALGGTRFWQYQSTDDAITDALRLARGMTYKSAVAGVNLGGGKSVIIGDNRRVDREALFRAHGRFIETLGGRYITAEDIGTSPADMEYIKLETDHVAGLLGLSGDPSPVTAFGVYVGIKAAAKWRWGTDRLTARAVAVQGCGNVATHLCRHLHVEGVKLFVTDIDPAKVARVVKETGATAMAPGQQPARRGPPWRPAGAAADTLRARLRHQRRRCDQVYGELHRWPAERSLKKAGEIYDTLLRIFQIAKDEQIPTYRAADRLAEQRIAALASLDRTWMGSRR